MRLSRTREPLRAGGSKALPTQCPTGHYGSAATSETKYKRSIETSLPHF